MKLSDDRALVMTTDFFPPVVDDPFTFGRIAAANALSDVYAMGGRPLAALNLLGVPKELPSDAVGELLAGGADMVRQAGAAIIGGHTVRDVDLKYGLSVTGEVHPDRFVRNTGVQPNDFLVLTKPLGTGLITTSIKNLGNRGPVVDEAVRWMTTLNDTGLDVILQSRPHAMTDVTGFGLLGHLSEMLGEDPMVARLQRSRLPRISGVEECFHAKCKTRAARTTAAFLGDKVSFHPRVDDWTRELLFDPQTSGGLLIALPPSRADNLVRRLQDQGLEQTAVIGSVTTGAAPGIQVLDEPVPLGVAGR